MGEYRHFENRANIMPGSGIWKPLKVGQRILKNESEKSLTRIVERMGQTGSPQNYAKKVKA